MNFKKLATDGTITIVSAFVLAMAVIFAVPFSAMAQEVQQQEEKEEKEDPWADVEFPFEDEMLLNFFDANQEISKMQRETNEKLAESVAEHGLTMERFNQIARAAQIGALQGGAFSPEELEAFNEAAPKVTALQREMQGNVQLMIAEFELTMDNYRDILAEFRQNRQLQEYVTYLATERAKEKIREERRREAEQKAAEEKNNNGGSDQ